MRIPHIAKTHEERVLKGLNFAVKHQRGYKNHLRARCGAAVTNEFVANGFIKDYDSKEGFPRFKVTKAGNKYYKDTYGTLNFCKAIAIGLVQRFLGVL